MGRGFCTRKGGTLRAAVLALTLVAMRPSVAEAGFWCWLLGDCGGGGGSGTSQQRAPESAAPEVDPGTLATAIALAAGGAAVLGDRVRRRR